MPYCFETTVWALIHDARDRRSGALDDVIRRYWEPIRRFIEGRGFSPQDAEDLAQEVFANVCRADFLQRADASKGRFRALLLSVTRHVIHVHLRERWALKRGGQVRTTALAREPEASPEEHADYNRIWAMHLMRGALERLRQTRAVYAEAIEMHYFEGLPYKEVAARLGRKEHDVKNFVFQGKKRLRDCLDQVIREFCSSSEEFQAELEELSRYLP